MYGLIAAADQSGYIIPGQIIGWILARHPSWLCAPGASEEWCQLLPQRAAWSHTKGVHLPVPIIQWQPFLEPLCPAAVHDGD